jgi:methylated-DNA-[protein]-cysteine S-methyltransferase
MTLDATVIDAPFGPLSLVAHGGTLVAATFSRDVDDARGYLVDPRAAIRVHDNLGEISAAVSAYLDGDAIALDGLAVRARGSAVMQALWQRLRAVPAGTTVSYAQLGGEPRLARVAATACARNPICVIVPCHRVIRSDGGLGGFGGGLDAKRWLLAHEASWRALQAVAV